MTRPPIIQPTPLAAVALFALFALVFGIINGMIAARLLREDHT
jgi:uncharacterized membrane-anchored protein YhcB (DUF1043 family)